MKSILTFLALIILVNSSAQDQGDKAVLKKLADDIVAHTHHTFKHKKTHEVFATPSKDMNVKDVKLSSAYTDWKYWNGVLNIALLKYASYTGDDKYKETVFKNYEFAFKNRAFFVENYPSEAQRWHHPFGLIGTSVELDDCGAMSGALIEVYKEDKQKVYKKYIDATADHMLNKQFRLVDGTLVRDWPYKYTLWADDLYMSIVFLARMGTLTGDQKYFDDAAKQVVSFNNYLFNNEK